jgi:hypothetical protein
MLERNGDEGSVSRGGLLSTVRFLRITTATVKCMIDERYGRHTPCEALCKSKKCMIDDGYGRYTPCGALVRKRVKGRA